MREYGSVLTVLTGMDVLTPEQVKIDAAMGALHHSFLAAAREHGFPEDATYEVKTAAPQPAYSVYRHDGGEVDYDDPGLVGYYNGGDLPNEYYMRQSGWRHDYGWYYAANS